MSIRQMAAIVAAASVLLSVPVAHADPFVAATFARTSTEFEDVKDGNGFAFSAGYELPQVPIFFEGEYYTSGQMKADNDPDFPELDDLRVSYRGILGYVGYALKLNGGSRLWLKGGYYSIKGKTSLDGDSVSEKDANFTLGLGGDWMFSEQIGLRAEIETPFKVKSAPGLDLEEKDRSQLSIIRVGLVWRPKLASSSSTSASSGGIYGENPNTAVSEPSYTPPVSAPAPAPATKLLAPFATGSTATVRGGSRIRAQPKTDSVLMGSAAGDTSVTLAGSTSNVGGEWWYVKSAGLNGWVLASDLVSP
ncbi:MAG: outer membrane beta-barrel protein [Pseudomonadota bacterium]